MKTYFGHFPSPTPPPINEPPYGPEKPDLPIQEPDPKDPVQI